MKIITYHVPYSAEGIIELTVILKDKKGNKRTDSIKFAMRPFDFS